MSGAVNVLKVHTATGDVLGSATQFLVMKISSAGNRRADLLRYRAEQWADCCDNGQCLSGAADDFNLSAGTLIQSGSATGNQVMLRGGQVVGDGADPDPVGAVLTLEGTISSNSGQRCRSDYWR